MNLIADCHILTHSDTVTFQYSIVDMFNDDDVDGDMWDYRKLFLDFPISYLGGFSRYMHHRAPDLVNKHVCIVLSER